MAHFAEIDHNNVVIRVVVVDDENTIDENGNESELVGKAYLNDIFGGTWKQCSYSSSIRGVFPGTGFVYDPVEDIFIDPETATEEPAAS